MSGSKDATAALAAGVTAALFSGATAAVVGDAPAGVRASVGDISITYGAPPGLVLPRVRGVTNSNPGTTDTVRILMETSAATLLAAAMHDRETGPAVLAELATTILRLTSLLTGRRVDVLPPGGTLQATEKIKAHGVARKVCPPMSKLTGETSRHADAVSDLVFVAAALQDAGRTVDDGELQGVWAAAAAVDELKRESLPPKNPFMPDQGPSGAAAAQIATPGYVGWGKNGREDAAATQVYATILDVVEGDGDKSRTMAALFLCSAAEGAATAAAYINGDDPRIRTLVAPVLAARKLPATSAQEVLGGRIPLMQAGDKSGVRERRAVVTVDLTGEGPKPTAETAKARRTTWLQEMQNDVVAWTNDPVWDELSSDRIIQASTIVAETVIAKLAVANKLPSQAAPAKKQAAQQKVRGKMGDTRQNVQQGRRQQDAGLTAAPVAAGTIAPMYAGLAPTVQLHEKWTTHTRNLAGAYAKGDNQSGARLATLLRSTINALVARMLRPALPTNRDVSLLLEQYIMYTVVAHAVCPHASRTRADHMHRRGIKGLAEVGGGEWVKDAVFGATLGAVADVYQGTLSGDADVARKRALRVAALQSRSEVVVRALTGAERRAVDAALLALAAAAEATGMANIETDTTASLDLDGHMMRAAGRLVAGTK